MKDLNKKAQEIVDKIISNIMKTASIAVAVIFLIFSLGSLYGLFIAEHSNVNAKLFLIIPPLLGLLAYYSRGFAFILLILLLLLWFIF